MAAEMKDVWNGDITKVEDKWVTWRRIRAMSPGELGRAPSKMANLTIARSKQLEFPEITSTQKANIELNNRIIKLRELIRGFDQSISQQMAKKACVVEIEALKRRKATVVENKEQVVDICKDKPPIREECERFQLPKEPDSLLGTIKNVWDIAWSTEEEQNFKPILETMGLRPSDYQTSVLWGATKMLEPNLRYRFINTLYTEKAGVKKIFEGENSIMKEILESKSVWGIFITHGNDALIWLEKRKEEYLYTYFQERKWDYKKVNETEVYKSSNELFESINQNGVYGLWILPKTGESWSTVQDKNERYKLDFIPATSGTKLE